MQRQIPPQKPRPAPIARRHAQPPPVPVAIQEEGPRAPLRAAKQRKPRVRAKGQHSRWLSHPDDLRRGIVLSEILGPPKALQDLDA